MRHTIFPMLLALAAFGCGGGAPSKGLDPSFTSTTSVPNHPLIQISGNIPTTATVSTYKSNIEASPYDGVVLALQAGRVVFQSATYSSSALTADKNLLPSINSGKLSENFLLMRGEAESTFDMFNDSHWATAEANIRTFAQMAKLGNFKGIAFDPESYSGFINPFYYPSYNSGTHTFSACQAKLRQRGAQFMTALQQEYPNSRVFMFGAMSNLKLILEDGRTNPGIFATNLPTHPYGLLPSFLNGMLDTIAPGMEIVDGNEATYTYYRSNWYDYEKGVVTNDGKALIDSANLTKYANQVKVGMSTWLDNSLDLTNNSTYLPHYFPDSSTRLQFLQYQLFHNFRTSDRYVWIYSEQTNWYTRSNIPAGLENAMNSLKNTVAAGNPLGFNLDTTITTAETAWHAAGN